MSVPHETPALDRVLAEPSEPWEDSDRSGEWRAAMNELESRTAT